MGILDRFSLRGRVALVTAGAGPLFGSSISQALAEAGATATAASDPAAGPDGFSPQEASAITAAMVAAKAAAVLACRLDGRRLCWIMMRWGRMAARQKRAASKAARE